MADLLLDTNILIKALRSDHKALDFLDGLKQKREIIFVSVISRMEILAGMRPHEEERTMAFLDSLDSLAVDETIADQAGRIVHLYARQGTQLSFPDALIAATALHHSLTLVTTNTRHFPIPELTMQELN
jgi:predicted nucleic acid-binding protein